MSIHGGIFRLPARDFSIEQRPKMERKVSPGTMRAGFRSMENCQGGQLISTNRNRDRALHLADSDGVVTSASNTFLTRGGLEFRRS